MKLETGKSYHLVYPTAPLPYVAKFVAFNIGTDETDDVTLEFLVDERELPIKLAQIKSGEVSIVSIEPKKDIREGTKTSNLNDAIERSLQMSNDLKERRAAAWEQAAARTESNVQIPEGKPQDQENKGV